MLKRNFLRPKKSLQNIFSFIFWKLSFTLICDSCMSSCRTLISLKLCVGFSIFDSVFFLLRFIFFLRKNMDSLTLKSHNSFRNSSKRKATHNLAIRPLIFKLQQEVWKFNDIWVSWSCSETDLETIFINAENRNFVYVFFPNSNF